MSQSQKSSLFTTAAAAGASIGDVWEFSLLLPSSRRHLAPDNRQVTVWSPYRRLTFNETHLRPVCSCLLTQCASQAQSLRRQVFYGQYMAVKSALKERKCHKASVRMRRRMSHTASVQECNWNIFATIFRDDAPEFQCFYTKVYVSVYFIVPTSKLHLAAIYLSNNMMSVSSGHA